MELLDNEKSLPTHMSHHAPHFDPILLEPPTTKPPVQAPKPASCQIPDFDPINFSVTSDVSEFDGGVFPNNAQNARSYLPPSEYNELSPARIFSNFNIEPTPSVHPKIKHLIEGVHEPASGNFPQCAGTSLNSNINGTLLQPSRQKLISPKLQHFTNNLPRNCILDNNGEIWPEFNLQYEMNPSFTSGRQNISGPSSNFENVKCSRVSQGVPNLLNKSDSVILVSKQLEFQESNNGMNDYFNASNNIAENVSNPVQMHRKFRKHHSLEEREEGLVHLKYQQKSQSTDSGISLNNGLNKIDTNTKNVVPDEIWTLLHEQNEKIKKLQDQLSTIHQQNNTKSDSKQETEVQVSDSKKFDMINNRLDNILQYLADNNNAILTLRDEVSILTKRTEALELKSKNNISEQPAVSSYGAFSNVETDVAPNKGKSKDDKLCHNKTQVKTTSTSTMTSIALEGSEKLLLRKTTVVTENCQQGVVLQSSQNTKSPLNKSQNHSNKCATNCPKCTTPKSLDKKKTKSKEKVKSKQDCENVASNGDLCCPASSAVKLRTCNLKKSSPLSDSNKENKTREIRWSPEEKDVPNGELIRRNIDMAMGKNCNEESLEKGYCHHNKANDISPGIDASKAKRKSKTQKIPEASTSTSEDYDYAYPNFARTNIFAVHAHDDSTIKKYGIPSPLLSIDTQCYLEKHHLFENSEKWSSKKSRVPPSRRQLR